MFGDSGIASDQDIQTGGIGVGDFTQRDECPLEDGQPVAPAIVGLKRMDSDGADCRMPTADRNDQIAIRQRQPFQNGTR